MRSTLDHTIAYLPGGSLSTLVKPVSHSQKKPVNHYPPPPRVGSLKILATFPVKGLKKSSNFSRRLVFAYPLGHESQSVTFEKSSPPPGGGWGLSNGMLWTFHPNETVNSVSTKINFFVVFHIQGWCINAKKWNIWNMKHFDELRKKHRLKKCLWMLFLDEEKMDSWCI